MAPRFVERTTFVSACVFLVGAVHHVPVGPSHVQATAAIDLDIGNCGGSAGCVARSSSADTGQRSRWKRALAVVAGVVAASQPEGVGAYSVAAPRSMKPVPAPDERAGVIGEGVGASPTSEDAPVSASRLSQVMGVVSSSRLEDMFQKAGPLDVEGAYWMPQLSVHCDKLRKRRDTPNGVVLAGRLRDSDIDVEVEVLQVKSLHEREVALKAAQALRDTSGGNVVTAYRLVFDLPGSPPGLELGGSEAGAVFFLTETGDSDLQEVMRNHNIAFIPETIKLRLLIQLLRGLRQMERAGWQHRGVEPRNLKIFGDCHSLCCDLKLAGFSHAGPLGERATASSWGAGVDYTAPEVLEGRGDQSRADVYSAGVVAYELFVGGLPGKDLGNDDNFKQFASRDKKTARLIRQMLRNNTSVWPWVRPNLEQSLLMAETVLAREFGEIVEPIVEQRRSSVRDNIAPISW